MNTVPTRHNLTSKQTTSADPGQLLWSASLIQVWSRIVFFLTACKPAPCIIQIHNLVKTFSHFRVCYYRGLVSMSGLGLLKGKPVSLSLGPPYQTGSRPWAVTEIRLGVWLGVCVLLGWVWLFLYGLMVVCIYIGIESHFLKSCLMI